MGRLNCTIKLRVFANGRGSYDIIAPRVKALIANHRTRPITARVTLTSGVTDVVRIYRHLKNDLGFHEVGFAPVTTSPDRLYSISERGMDGVLEQFHALAEEWLEYALRGEMHGFSNVSDTIAELYQGVNKSHPCGAALGLDGRRTFRRYRAVPPLRRFRHARARQCLHRRSISKSRPTFSIAATSTEVRMPDVLGAPLVRRRLPSRSFCTIRRYRSSQPALLRLDQGLDRHVFADFRRDQRAKSGVLGAICGKEGVELRHLKAVNKKARRIDGMVSASLENAQRTLRKMWSRCRIPRSVHTFQWAAPWRSPRVGKWIRPAARRGCVNRWSATYTIAM